MNRFVTGAAARGLRAAVLGVVGAVLLAVLTALAYQLAAARVPQHREALERLVQAHTGLDVRFDQLGLRWGWYGPEAVFQHVELGEPGQSRILLRAPQLIVGFDAWRTLQSGQLQAGHITLIAPDIDLERGAGEVRLSVPAPRVGMSSAATTARVFERWRGGRIDAQGGSLRLADPTGSPEPLMLGIRRIALTRTDDRWSVRASLVLPERLGATLHLSARVTGKLSRPKSLTGDIGLDGEKLAFAGWHRFLTLSPALARYVPKAGGGDATVRLSFRHGRIEGAEGELHAAQVSWADSQADGVRTLALERLQGVWRLARQNATWRLTVDNLGLGKEAARGLIRPRATVEIESDGSQLRGEVTRMPLASLASVAGWLAPQLDLAGMEFGGTAHDVTFDWNAERPNGERLLLGARLEEVSVAPASNEFLLVGLKARVSGTENELGFELQAQRARLELGSAPEHPLMDLRVAAQLQLSRLGQEWRLATDALSLQNPRGRVLVSGELRTQRSQHAPAIDVRVSLAHTDIAVLQELFGADLGRRFGPVAQQMTAGLIENAHFALAGSLQQWPFADGEGFFSGSVRLRDAHLGAGESWPDTSALDARIEWGGAHLRATIDQGKVLTAPGVVPLESLKGSLDFEAGRLQNSTLTAHWLGGPVSLALSQRRQHRAVVYAVQAQGLLDARELATLGIFADLPAVHGETEWTGDFLYRPRTGGALAAQWSARAEASLLGLASPLPEPLTKPAGVAAPLHLEISGSSEHAQVRVMLADRWRSAFELVSAGEAGWRIERGSVHFGAAGSAVLPSEPIIAVGGKLARLELPPYLAAWNRAKQDPLLPPVRGTVFVGQLSAAGGLYSDANLYVRRGEQGFEFQIEPQHGVQGPGT